ncbi:MAG: molybdenum cofactor guanylyltransferase [Chloroflexi bacterium]|nr:molybdenum cofactor guanylyltransferase [Chloroflexota bacterium]
MFVAPIVLAGGKSTRFGRDKISEMVAGQTLIQRVVNCLASFGDEIIIVLAPGGSIPPLAAPVKLRKVFDIYPGRGSLGGVYTGISLSSCQYNLVVACDMPFMNMQLLRHMIDLSPGYDVVIPKVGKHVEPLHAVYSKSCLPIIERIWAEGKTKVLDILEYARTYYLREEEIDRFDPRRLSFFNINTSQDLQRAAALASETEASTECKK